MTNAIDAGKRYFGIQIPFMDVLELSPEALWSGYARTRIALRSALTNSRGDFHGGVLMSALDATMGVLARSENSSGGGVATIDLTTSFLAPATTDIVIEARTLRCGNSLAFIEGEIRNQDGQLVAKASGTFKLLKSLGLPTTSDIVQPTSES
jgi:uncharacterized protein (TIGR00369 family)